MSSLITSLTEGSREHPPRPLTPLNKCTTHVQSRDVSRIYTSARIAGRSRTFFLILWLNVVFVLGPLMRMTLVAVGPFTHR